MKVLFINPHYPMETTSILLHPTLAYAYMATELKRRGHEVAVLDLPMRTNCIYDEADYLTDFAPDIVGVTCVTQSYCQALEVVRYSKEVLPRVPVAMGGPHVTFTPEETLNRHKAVDYVMLYDCDLSFADLVDALSMKDLAGLSKISGLAYRENSTNGIIVNPVLPPLMSLDEYPVPDRSIFDMQQYLDHDYETVVMTARGCPSRCSFCSTTLMGRKYRYHGVERVVDEFQSLVEFGFSSFFIGDDTFAANTQRTVDICQEINRRGLEFYWTSNMRALDARPESLSAMSQAGSYRVFMGFETVSRDSLKKIRKGTTPERYINAVERVKSAGLELHAAFIIGAPGDTEDDLEATMEFIREVKPTVATFNTIEVRPGTDMFTNPEKYGLTIPDRYWYETTDWMNLPTCYTETLTQKDIKDWVERCYFEFCTAGFEMSGNNCAEVAV